MEQDLISKIKSKKSIAMLAPSFVIDFSYPNIIGMLKKIGFNKVCELTFGARMVNWHYVEFIKNNPEQKCYIASPCPTVVSYIKSKHPNLISYLVPIASPMLAQARIIKKHYPDYQNIFISPCFAKQNIEAPLYPEAIDGVINFKELGELFSKENIFTEDFERNYQFDSLIQEYTKIYPVSGGLSNTSHIAKYFKPEEIYVHEGLAAIEPVLRDIENGSSKIRFLDILNCPGGCIGGPAIVNQHMSTSERKKRVKHYIEEASERALGPHAGRLDYAEGVEMKVEF